MKRSLLLMALLAMAMPLLAEFQYDVNEDVKLRLGADIRARYETFDRTVVAPGGFPGGNSPANQYYRFRTRVWTALDFGEDVTFNLRLANRSHYVTSSPNKPNNSHGNHGSTWQFPDETYIDAANIVVRNFLMEHVTLTLGRQALAFGNGLLFAEGTPFDQGRSVYTDGLHLRYDNDGTKVSLFALYDTWKDRWPVINDRNRRLRSGDIFTLGAYATQEFSKAFALDVYYMYNDVEDRQPREAERNHYADASASLHTFGLRAFGRPLDLISYSLEVARQAGYNNRHGDIRAYMADARLRLHLPEVMGASPSFGLEAACFSGDKPNDGDTRGWNPLMIQCPLWSEELMPIMLNGNWTNLRFGRVDFTTEQKGKWKFMVSATDYTVMERRGGAMQATGGGDHLGLLLSADVSYKVCDNLSLLAQFSHFMPGDYYRNGHSGNWARLEATLSF